MKRLLIVFLVLSTVASAGLVVAQSETTTGPFDRDDLVSNGVHDSDAPDSVRMLGSPVRGSASVRHIPASPLQSEWQFVAPGQTVKTDRIQIYSTAFGDAAGDYELVIVQWSDRMQQVETENGTTKVPVAADQTVQRIDVTIDEGYSATEVRLASQYNESKQVTMWMERDGQRLDGVTWRFQHKSVASGEAVAIQTQADAWWYALRTAVLPGIAGIIAGLSLAQATLRKTGTGPRYGLGAWIFLGVLGFGVAAGGMYYEVARVIANFDLIMGLSLGVVAYGGGLRMHSPIEYVGFERLELRDALSLRRQEGGPESTDGPDPLTDGGRPQTESVIEIPTDGYQDELYEDLVRLPTVRNSDGDRHVPMKGIGPFIARLFADAARLNLSQIRTRVRVRSGCISEKVYINPESEQAVTHTPARLKRRMPVWHRISGVPAEEMDTSTKLLYGALTAATLALPLIGWHVGASTLQTPVVGAAVGTIILAVESYGAHDGSLEFDVAPRHDMTANASLTILQDEHSDAKLLEEFEEIAWNERSRTALEAREVEGRRDRSIVQRLNESALGMELGVLGGDSATEEEKRRADELLGGPSSEEEARADGGSDDER